MTFLNNLTTPNAKSAHNMSLFGQKKILVQEFVNPHDFHFQSIQVIYWEKIIIIYKLYAFYIQVLETSGIKAQENEKWNSGDTWFPGTNSKCSFLDQKFFKHFSKMLK